MTAKRFYSILLILLGFGLIIGGFQVFGANLEQKVRILDIVASCVLFSQYVILFIHKIVDLDKPAQKEIGMVGIHYTTLSLCTVLSIALMIYGIHENLPFNYQLAGQMGILFILILGRLFTLQAGDKVEEIYEKEQATLEGKVTMRASMDDFMDELATRQGVDAQITDRLKEIHESLRFITPSATAEAKQFDAKFAQTLSDLSVMLRDASHNGDRINEEVAHLERIVARRKKTYN